MDLCTDSGLASAELPSFGRKKKKERPRQQGNPCLRKFKAGTVMQPYPNGFSFFFTYSSRKQTMHGKIFCCRRFHCARSHKHMVFNAALFGPSSL